MGGSPGGDRATLIDSLRDHARRTPGAPALLAPERAPLSYAGLLACVEATARALRARGVGPADRVALVLPNGPEAASAFLGIASAAAVAPLDPGSTEAEFRARLEQLKPRALVLAGDGSAAAASAAARAHGIPEIPLHADPARPAGDFRLDGDAGGGGPPEGPEPGAVALLLPTSGTTARPKIVPILHSALAASAANIAATLALTPADRCLNPMPLFHVHGLVGALASSVAAGASVSCAPGYLAPRLLPWLASERPTWITAVPTILQSILDRARGDAAAARAARLRFLRSSSAALPPTVAAGLEEAFGAPVLEAYGMTEACHQMASNPLPPGARKIGSVGRATGLEIAVLDAAGAPVDSGAEGEIAIRGRTVTPGYLDNEEANRAAFAGGWFRTGDRGRLDGDGYLFVTGRLKELVNRGGEKIAPREVEEALLAHPAVAEAACFAVPHPTLGEEVGAAAVLAAGAAAGEPELRRFASVRLATYKVPRRILLVPSIPRGPTGKVQRVGMAARLGLGGGFPVEAEPAADANSGPPTPAEERIAGILAEVLGREGIDRHRRFEDLGLDSMLGLAFVERVRKATGREVVLLDLFDHPTVARLATRLDGAV